MTNIVDDNYGKLAGLLRGREGWRPEVQDGERFWCFGVDGAARLVITPDVDGFLVYGAEENRQWFFPGTEAVKDWLEENEQVYAGPTALQVEFGEALERARERRREGGSGAGA